MLGYPLLPHLTTSKCYNIGSYGRGKYLASSSSPNSEGPGRARVLSYSLTADAGRFSIAGWSRQLYRLRQALIDLRALAPVFHSSYTMALPRCTIALERHGPL